MSGQGTVEEMCINTIRFLAADAIEMAKSGHPGCDGGGGRSLHPLDGAPEAQPGQSPWSTATASSCQPDMDRCSSTRSSTDRL